VLLLLMRGESLLRWVVAVGHLMGDHRLITSAGDPEYVDARDGLEVKAKVRGLTRGRRYESSKIAQAIVEQKARDSMIAWMSRFTCFPCLCIVWRWMRLYW
jgi:hypothetical protein